MSADHGKTHVTSLSFAFFSCRCNHKTIVALELDVTVERDGKSREI